MNKKILIGSIGAVIIIVLAGFTSVVGVQTNENSVKLTSPLFGVRTQSAIRSNDDVLTTVDYVGEGSTFLASSLTCNLERIRLNNVIKKIRNMDDETYMQFVNKIIGQYCKNVKMSGLDLQKIRSIFLTLKDDLEGILFMQNINEGFQMNGAVAPPEYTDDGVCTTGGLICWLLAIMCIGFYICIIIMIILEIFA